MSNKLKEDLKKYDFYEIEEKCDKELIQFRKNYFDGKKKISLNENYIKTNYEDIVSGNYFIPYPLLVHISRFYDPEELGSDNSFTKNMKLFDKEHTWFDGCGMKKTCHGIKWFMDDEKNYEDILLYTVSKFIEWYPEHSELLIIKDNL